MPCGSSATSSATGRNRTGRRPAGRDRGGRRPRATTMRRPSAAPRSTGSIPTPARPRSGPAGPIGADDPRVAGGPARRAGLERHDARPRQPARPAARVHDDAGHRPRQPGARCRPRTACTATPTCRSPSTMAGRAHPRPGPATATASTSATGATLLNPGSVGQPRDGDPRASYLILDPRPRRVTWHRVGLRHRRRPGGDARGRPAGRLAERLRGRHVTRLGWPMIGGRRPLQGRKPGDRRVRVERPHAPYFRYTGPGTLTAKEAASVPTTPAARALAPRSGRRARRAAGPRRRRSASACRRRKALAIFSSDAISSSGVRDRGDILRVHPRRRRAGRARRRPAGRASPSPPSSRSSRSATARCASPTRTAAARTPCRRRTSAGWPRSSRRRRCSSTTT